MYHIHAVKENCPFWEPNSTDSSQHILSILDGLFTSIVGAAYGLLFPPPPDTERVLSSDGV